MGQKLVIGPLDKGFVSDKTRKAFVIDNESFPTLINSNQWRGRVIRKRGTSQLTRFIRTINAAGITDNFIYDVVPQVLGTIVPGSISIVDASSHTWTDSATPGVLKYLTNLGTIDYSTGVFTGPTTPFASGSFKYYVNLPVMGLEEFQLPTSAFPGSIGFDTTYSYNISTASPYTTTDVTFYKNPLANGTTLPGYTPKVTPTPFIWNGKDYQQFWTTNYENAMWATNGVQVPFNTSNIGMQFKPIVAVTVSSGGPPAIVNLQITGHGLVVGDFVFINEVVTTTGINWQTGYVTVVVNSNNVTVEFPNATIATNGTGGIAQYLTNTAIPGIDCLRWYDGNVPGQGWVNFMPPIIFNIDNNLSISDLPTQQIYYLIGAKLIYPFKDRLLFFGPVVQSSSAGPYYLQDTVIYSQNGTPYYTSSSTGDPTFATTIFYPVISPVNQTANSSAYFEDVTGFGGFQPAGVQQAITTVSPNEDALVVGFSNSLQTRMVYTGNDIGTPFNFFIINAELGSSSTFSSVTMDEGVISRGPRGFIITSQTSCNRIDLDILDQVFEIASTNNGSERFCAQRDFVNEWIYFTYPSNEWNNIYPNQTLLFNYRDNTWAIFNESYTTYGTFRPSSGYTWATIGSKFATWAQWNEPWNAGSTNVFQPQVIAGTTQGFVMQRGEGTTEFPSIEINNISFTSSITGATPGSTTAFASTGIYAQGEIITVAGVVGSSGYNGTFTVIYSTGSTVYVNLNSTGFTYTSGGFIMPQDQIYSPNHCLNNGDYIIISQVIGNIGWQVNNRIFGVFNVTSTGFAISPTITQDTYFGNGVITRLYVPQIQTKQFPMAWEMMRKTRIGPQAYLLSTTQNGQITLQIFLSQDSTSAWNNPIVNTPPNSLIYSQVLYTCPESTNLGLTPFNINLQTPTAFTQQQIWHRVNTSLIGDTVQLGFTLSDAQMRMYSQGNIFTITNIVNSVSGMPTVITAANTLGVNNLVLINGVQGMTQLNGNVYIVTASNSSTFTIGVDSSSFGTYISGGTATTQSIQNQTSEIELHGIIMDLSPSQLLV